MADKIALYARVSSDEQAERQTIQVQLERLRGYAKLHDLEVYREYIDDGVSGTLPVDQRPMGHKLLQDALAKRFNAIVFYKIDRLSRKQRCLLDVYETLDKADISLRSMTEPFDTGTPVGRFMMQMLGSMAELERETIIDRTTAGRDRRIREGYFHGGPVPFGYDVSNEGILVPSTRVLQGSTEAEVLEQIFQKIAAGDTLADVCRWLNGSNIPSGKRYQTRAGKVSFHPGQTWRLGTLSKLVRNRVYVGEYTYRAKHAEIKASVTPLISRELFAAVQVSINEHKRSVKPGDRINLLRGLIKCGFCGGTFVATPMYSRGRYNDHYYRCSNQIPSNRLQINERCKAKQLKATAYEDMLWSACRGIIVNPDAVIPAAKGFYEKLCGVSRDASDQRQVLQDQLRDVLQQHSRAMQLFIRQGGDFVVVEQEIDRLNKEKAHLEYQLAQIDHRKDLLEIQRSFIEFTETLLASAQHQLSVIDASEQYDKTDSRYITGRMLKVELMQALITRIICITYLGDGGRKKDADLKVYFRLGKEMSKREWLKLGGFSPELVGNGSVADLLASDSGQRTVSNLLASELGNCNVGPDAGRPLRRLTAALAIC
jgi:site-specific DNA recombinase